MIPIKSYKVLIASPSDVDKERRLLKRVIDNVNDYLKTFEYPCRLELYSWNDDTYSDIGPPEQNLLKQIPIEGADILIAIFWKKFGTATGDYRRGGQAFLSGTEEEIEKAIEVRQKTGKPVIMVFRKLDRIPADLSDADLEQLRLLLRYLSEFKKAGEPRGLIKEFKSREFSSLLTKALLKLMADHQKPLTKTSEPLNWVGVATASAAGHKTRNQTLVEIVKKSVLDTEKLRPQVINFWGGKGIGKTTLLNEISNLQETERWPVLGPIDCEVAQDKTFHDLANSLKASSKMLVLFDNIDAVFVHDGRLQDLERVVRILLDANSIVIVTSQYRIYQWSRDIKFHQRDHRIPLLTDVDISELLHSNKISDEFVFTFGYPQIITWLLNENLNEQSLVQKAAGYFMAGLPADAKKLLLHISLLPLFNLAVLERINEPLDKHFVSYSQYTDMLNAFERAGLIYWDEEWGLYRFVNSSTRRSIAKYHWYDDPTSYRRTHQLAANYFKDEAERRSYFPYFFVSAVYHTLMECEDKYSARKMALDWLDQNIQPGTTFDQTAFAAWESGGKEPDVRLEIQEALTANNYLDVLQRLAAAKKAMEV